MLNDREKLIDLIENAPVWKSASFHEACTQVADHLIANGVTVQRWIPVTERLPTWADGNKYGEILAVRRGHELSDFYHLNDVKENPDEFTHWMPLPQPPKDGE